ncbi:MAG: helix-turn-helix transcriptional regulator [Filimonas sp.]|nr:helix-turn-helix transcriptional regulator [Filimonas sp.]
MHDLTYYISTNKKCVVDLIDHMRTISGKNFYVEGDHVVFPPELAEGRMEFYELADNLSLLLIDFVLHKQLFNLMREPVRSNDYYVMFISLDSIPVQIEANNKDIQDLGGNLNNAVYFSSTANAIHFYGNGEGHRKRLGLIFTKSLLYNYLQRYAVPVSVPLLQNFINDVPLQFRAQLDLNSLHVVEDIFNVKLPLLTRSLYYTGDAMRLLAIFLNNIIEISENEENFKFDDVGRIMKLVDGIDIIDSEIPSLEQAAEDCLMSKSKFIKLFKVVYKLSYGDFFLEKKLSKAAELLRSGMQVSDVGYRIGYSNLGHFAAAFKKHYKQTPKQYQLQQPSYNDD